MDSTVKNILEHLEDLRFCIIKSVIAPAILFPFTWMYSTDGLDFVRNLCLGSSEKLYYMQPMELFIVKLKISAIAAIILSLPWIFWQLWTFVSPGLFKKERKMILSFTLVSSILFCAGASLALFVVYPLLMKFASSMGSEGIQPMISVDSFVNLAALLMLGFGITFQLPVILVILVAAGILSTAAVRKARPYIVVGIFVFSAFITPSPDALSQLAMAIPSIILFECGLLVAALFEKKSDKE